MLTRACLYEYQAKLSLIGRHDLPELRDTDIGWCLAADGALKNTEPEGEHAKQRIEAANNLLRQMIKDHAGTPYEILARRNLRQNLGLVWKPLPPG